MTFPTDKRYSKTNSPSAAADMKRKRAVRFRKHSRKERWMRIDMPITRRRSGSWPISPVKRMQLPAVRTKTRAICLGRTTEAGKGHIGS
ncbi:hypothetical protein AMS62_13185 [Bacillus sp. FJAT-18019]|nr:hypothetical protein AMS62_13185 [Bacillus sp. FJAT-18019]